MMRAMEPALTSRRTRRHWIRYALPLSGVVVLLAGGGFAAFETDTVESYWEGVWWALSLITTVGFAGAVPQSLAGKLISAALMVVGFALLATLTAAVASLFVREAEEPAEELELRLDAQLLGELRDVRERLERIESRLPDA